MFLLIRNVLDFLFPVVDYVPAVLARLLAAFDGKLHEMMLKINVTCPWL